MLGRLYLGSGVGLLLIGSLATAQPPGGFPGGPLEPPKPGQVLPGLIQDQLKLTAEQKKKLEELQKEVDAKLAKILTDEQRKSLEDMRRNPFGFGPGEFGPPGGFGPPGALGGWFGQTRLEDVKKQIGSTDEEWKVIEPKLKKVIAARRVLSVDVRPTDDGFGGAFPGGFGGPTESNIITQAQAELKAVLDDPKHTRAEVEEKVAAVRKARQKACAEAEAAQKDLLLLLTAAQEAVLVSLGYVE